MRLFSIIGVLQRKENPFFHETLFLKNIFKLHHITDEQGALKSDYFFRCMGLDEEEVSVIKEIFEHTPREWKYDLGRHTSVDGLNIEFVFHEKKNPIRLSEFKKSIQVVHRKAG